MLAQGYKFEKNQAKLAEVIIAEFALPVDLQFEAFEATADDATFRAKAILRDGHYAGKRGCYNQVALFRVVSRLVHKCRCLLAIGGDLRVEV